MTLIRSWKSLAKSVLIAQAVHLVGLIDFGKRLVPSGVGEAVARELLFEAKASAANACATNTVHTGASGIARRLHLIRRQPMSA